MNISHKKTVIELAHRTCWRYRHSKDPNHSSTYTFNDKTLEHFAALVQFASANARAEREWANLTCEKVTALIREGAADGGWQGFATRIQNAFKEKNK